MLDVQLAVRHEFLGSTPRKRRVPVLAERPKGVGDGGARPVVTLGDVRGEPPESGGRSKEAHAETRALLVRPGHDLDRTTELALRIEQRLHCLDRAEHAERAIKPAAFGDRVQVGADDDREALPPGPRRFKTRPEVRGRIAMYARPARRKPSADEIARALLLARKAETCDRRSGTADPGELAHPALEPRSIDHRTCSASSSGPNVSVANTSRSTAFASGTARSISAA